MSSTSSTWRSLKDTVPQETEEKEIKTDVISSDKKEVSSDTGTLNGKEQVVFPEAASEEEADLFGDVSALATFRPRLEQGDLGKPVNFFELPFEKRKALRGLAKKEPTTAASTQAFKEVDQLDRCGTDPSFVAGSCLREVNNTEDEANLPSTRVNLEAAIQAKEKEMMKAGRARDFATARLKEKELHELMEFRDYLPSAVELLAKIDEMNKVIDNCIENRDWDDAEHLTGVLSGLEQQLAVEQKAESNRVVDPVASVTFAKSAAAEVEPDSSPVRKRIQSFSSFIDLETRERLKLIDDIPEEGDHSVSNAPRQQARQLKLVEKSHHRRGQSLPAGDAPVLEHGLVKKLFLDKPEHNRNQSSPTMTNKSEQMDPYDDRKHRKCRSLSFSEVDAPDEKPLFDCLTVFQAEPLVWVDKENNCHPFPRPPDFRFEKETLLEALKDAQKIGAQIDVTFETATTNRLGAFLATGESQVLHFSCHGDPAYLAIENEWGAMQALLVDEMKQFISSGREGQLKFVFVSACYSRRAGEAFIEAGVPHVVCCQQNEQLRDSAAVEFARSFYRALACGKKLRQAFQMAEAAVMVSPSVDGTQKFLLLPEKPDGDPYHEVTVFYTNPSRRRQVPMTRTRFSGRIRPPPPDIFLGREIALYSILEKLGSARLIQIVGSAGVGKSSLAKAACKYIDDRIRSFFFEEIFWLPPLDLTYDGELSRHFRQVLDILLDGRDLEPDTNTSYRHLCGNMVRVLQDKRALIFLDAEEMNSDPELKKLGVFLEVLFRGTLSSVILVCPPGRTLPSNRALIDARVELTPLDMRSSAVLFGILCPYVARRRCPTVHRPDELADLLVPDAHAEATCVRKSMSKRCADIFVMIGEGNPEKIRTTAAKMTAKEYDELIRLGMKPEFQRKVDTRVVLDQEVAMLSEKLFSAVKLRDYQQAQECKDTLEELWKLRGSLPALTDLRSNETELYTNLDKAVSSQDFSIAEDLQRQLSILRTHIKREEEALVKVTEFKRSETIEKTEAFAQSKTGMNDRANNMSISTIAEVEQKSRSASETKKDDTSAPSFTSATRTCLQKSHSMEYSPTNKVNDEKQNSTGHESIPDEPFAGRAYGHVPQSVGTDSIMSPTQIAFVQNMVRVATYSIRSRKRGKHSDAFGFTLTISQGSIIDFISTSPKSAIVCGIKPKCASPCYGVDDDVVKAGGSILVEDISDFLTVSNKQGASVSCETGDAKVIGPRLYGKLHVPHVIFASGPSFQDVEKGRMKSSRQIRAKCELLRSAYRSSLEAAKKLGLEAIAFSLLCARNCAGDHHIRTFRIAIEVIRDFEGYNDLKEIHLCASLPSEVEALVKIADELGLQPLPELPCTSERHSISKQKLLGGIPWNSAMRLRWRQKSRFSVKVVEPITSDPSASGLPNLGTYHVASGAGSFSLSILQGSVAGFSYPNQHSAIVCATNESCCLQSEGAVNEDVLQAGGAQLNQDLAKLPTLRESVWGAVRCPVGRAKIIGPQSYGELGVPHVIFSVGPSYSADDRRDVLRRKDALLLSAYRSSLELAKEAQLEAVAFSLISTGNRAGADLARPLRVAVKAICEVRAYKELREIHLCASSQQEATMLKSIVLKMGLQPQTILIDALQLGKIDDRI